MRMKRKKSVYIAPRKPLAPKVSIAFEILPLQILNIYLAVFIRVMIEHKYFAAHLRFLLIKLRTFFFKKRRLINSLKVF